MRMTFSDLIAICQQGAGNDTSAASLTFFKQRINARAGLILAKLPSHLSEITRTFSTVEDQQYYHYPPGNMKEIESLKITIGSVDYPLKPIHSNQRWNEINALTIQAGAIPTHYFKRQRDFGIYPIPQAAYTGTIVYSIRAGGMTATDYTTSTVTVVENDATVTGSGTTFVVAMPGRWFSLADTNGESRGTWYRIGSFTSTTVLELETYFEETGEAGASYIIGESPELPEEGHELCAHGALMDYFMSFRQAPGKAKTWSNLFWTGDPNTNKARAEAGRKPWTGGGLLGLINDYRDRDSSQLIQRRVGRGDPRKKAWASSIS